MKRAWFAGACCHCDAPISPGDVIRKARGGWLCTRCSAGDE